MVARQIKSSTKLVPQTLTGVGFEIEWRWVTLHRESGAVKKRARAYCIPDSQTWTEIMARYYYSEDLAELPEIPEVLKSQRFYGVSGSVPSVPTVPQKLEDHKDGTVYSTRD